VATQSDIYNLVERAAARRGVPRLQLWQAAAAALVEKRLLALNLSERMNPGMAMTVADWLIRFRRAVDRSNDPNNFAAHILKRIFIRESAFEQWLRNADTGRRGPTQDTTGYKAADRKFFPSISRMLKSGDARSAYGAALKLADKLAGTGTPESKAIRVSKQYRLEHSKNR
jgi:hypothetical protein